MTTAEIRQAIDDRVPVIFEGKEYPCINALIYRMIRDPYTGRYHTVVQVEIADKSRPSESAFIADPRKVSVKE